MEMAITAAGTTHPGQVRQNNEDAYYVTSNNGSVDPAVVARNGFLFIVTDGVGGNRGGARASAIATTRLPAVYYAAPNGDPAKNLRQAIDSVAREIVSEAAANPDRANMSCTIVAAVIKDGQATIVHLGDARAYLQRQRELRPLTKDHTWVQMQVERGTLTEAEAQNHPDRNVITKSMGNASFPEPTITQISLQEGDRLLLCSDGLSSVATDAEMAAILLRARDPQSATKELIAQANRKGGPDNVTAVLVQAGQPTIVPPPRKSNAPLLILLLMAAVIMFSLFLIFRPPGTATDATTATLLAGITAEATLVGTASSEVTAPLAEPSSTIAIIDTGTGTATITPTITEAASTPPAAATNSVSTPINPPVAPPNTVIVPPTTPSTALSITNPLICGTNHVSEYPGNGSVPFSWHWTGQVAGDNYLEVRVNGESIGRVPPEAQLDSGNWLWYVSASRFHTGNSYEWRVVYMAADTRTIIASSGSGCFTISGGGGSGNTPVPTVVATTPPPPNPDSDGDGVPDSEDQCPKEDQGSEPDLDRPGCPAPPPPTATSTPQTPMGTPGS